MDTCFIARLEGAIQLVATKDFLHGLSSELVTNFPVHLILAACQTLCEWPTAPILW